MLVICYMLFDACFCIVCMCTYMLTPPSCTILVLRGDVARLDRCVSIMTGDGSTMPRCKPFKYTYEKEIVMYAYYKGLDYFSTECIYSPYAYRGFAREFLKDLETASNPSIVDIIRSAEYFHIRAESKQQVLGSCTRCGYLSSNVLCKACVLLEGLNKGKAKMDIQVQECHVQY